MRTPVVKPSQSAISEEEAMQLIRQSGKDWEQQKQGFQDLKDQVEGMPAEKSHQLGQQILQQVRRKAK